MGKIRSAFRYTKGISEKSKKVIDILHGKGAATTVKVLTRGSERHDPSGAAGDFLIL